MTRFCAFSIFSTEIDVIGPNVKMDSGKVLESPKKIRSRIEDGIQIFNTLIFKNNVKDFKKIILVDIQCYQLDFKYFQEPYYA